MECSPHVALRALALMAVACAGAVRAPAGGHPLLTVVVVNTNSPDSLEVGRDYARVRGIPESHIVRVGVPATPSIAVTDWVSRVEAPLYARIDDLGLTNRVHSVVLSRDLPYRVYEAPYASNRHAGATAAIFYGFRATPGGGCSLPASNRQDYFQSERFFDRAGAPSSNRYLLAACLEGLPVEGLKTVARRAAAADFSSPSGLVLHARSSDPARNVQWVQYDGVDFLFRFLGAPLTVRRTNASDIVGQTNLLAAMIGKDVLNGLPNNHYLPGALGNHLTSFAGYLREPPGQTTIPAWLSAGAAGSYGTVVEPCNYPEKFPDARLHYWYARGFSLGEAHFMAVEAPYQGVVAGDPLCRPYGVPAGLALTGLVAGARVTGPVAVTLTATGTSNRPVDRIDLYLDDAFVATVTNVVPAPGNRVTATVNGSAKTYTVQTGDTLFDVADGLAGRINTAPLASQVTATPWGDRVETVQDAYGQSAVGFSCSVATAIGTAPELTVFARTPANGFLEGGYPAREGLVLSGAPVTGDRLAAVVTRLDGAIVTNEVVASPATNTAYALMAGLFNKINADSRLAGPDGCFAQYLESLFGETTFFLVARTNTWEGYNLFVDFQIATNVGSTLVGPAFSDNFNDNGDVLRARSEIFLAAGRTDLIAGHVVDTTALPDGPHTLTMLAREGTAVGTWTSLTFPFSASNHGVSCAIALPESGAYRPVSSVVTVQVAAAAAAGTVTQVALFVEGKLRAATNAAAGDFAWPGTQDGPGPVSLRAMAWTDAGGSAQSAGTTLQLYTDADGDSLPDQWEYERLGGAVLFGAGDDPDADGASNRDEFPAGTDPWDGQSVFRIVQWDGSQLGFVSSTDRYYRIEAAADLVQAVWTAAVPGRIRGTAGVTTGAVPYGATAEHFRVSSELP